MLRPGLLGALAICLAATLWGLDGVVLTPRLHNLEVPFVVLLVHAVPFLLMQPVLFSSYRKLRALPAGGWLALVGVAACGGLLGTFAIVKALFLVDFERLSVVVLLQKLQPVFAISLAALLLREPLSRRFLGRAALALVGAYLLTFGWGFPDLDGEPRTVAAAGWAALAAAAFGASTVLGKRLVSELDFRAATFGRYGLTALLALLFLLAGGAGLPLAAVTPENWLVVLLIALTTGSGAIFLYYFGLTRVRAAVSAICELCLPLSAVLLDYLVNDSRLGGWQWLGAAILVAAITLVSSRSGRERPSPRQAPVAGAATDAATPGA